MQLKDDKAWIAVEAKANESGNSPEKEPRSGMPEKGLNVLIDVEEHQAEINNLSEQKWMTTDPATGWRCIKTVVDSGASDSVAPP